MLERIIDVILFLGERGLAFRGSSQRIGDFQNGNFLGVLELISDYDPLLEEHLIEVRESQSKGERMSAHYLSAESHYENSKCVFPCACHSLNLVGSDSALVCPDVVTFFGMVQTVYNIFSCSPKRWEILNKHIGCSLHGLSGTRRTDRVASIGHSLRIFLGLEKL